ncbi:MAG: helix-turn-helix transcriptional regulator [Rhodobacteraceae bacterium]|nr:helix-turn-helix transcriptional regulator [Paracoccaceae bacterium]
MTDFIAFDLRPQLKKIVSTSGLTVRQLSARTGINKSRLSALLNSKAPLTVPDLQVLGFALGFDPRDLIAPATRFEVTNSQTQASLYQQKAADVARQLLTSAKQEYQVQGTPLTIDTMLRWYTRNGGRLTETDQIEQFVTVFPAPEPLDNMLVPDRIGHNALAAQSQHQGPRTRQTVSRQSRPRLS